MTIQHSVSTWRARASVGATCRPPNPPAGLAVSLGLDLMEEFRPLIVDQVVVAAARKHELRAEHGRREENHHGILLTKAGRKTLVSGYERRMLQHTRGALPGLSGSLRRHLYRQAERIAAYIGNPAAGWTGLSWR
jgi:CRISP-associated protein Cas1